MSDLTTMIGGGAAVGVLVGCWNYVKIYLHKIYGLFFITLEAGGDSSLIKALRAWHLTKCSPFRFRLKCFITTHSYVRPIGKEQLVGYHNFPKDPALYFYNKVPVIISNQGEKITFIRWTLDPEKVIQEAIDVYNSILGDTDKETPRFYIKKFHGTLNMIKGKGVMEDSNPGSGTKCVPCEVDKFLENIMMPLKWNRDELGKPKESSPLDYLALSDECLKVIDNLKLWKKSEKWYKERNIPWKKGTLLYGDPGCGKSSLAKALSMELNMPMMLFDLSSMSNNDFETCWNEAKSYSPCIILLEDIDAVFDLRSNVSGVEGGLTYNTLLNAIDGVQGADGLLVIASTNKLEKVDSALGVPNGHGLSTRPGRLDFCIKLEKPNKEGLTKIAKRILCDYPEDIAKIVEEGDHDSGAQFQERCSRHALARFWQGK